MTGSRCSRFGRLLNEVADREPTPDEREFLDRHRRSCPTCAQEEQAAALSLDLLRGAALSPEVQDSFDRRVLRRAKAQKLSDDVRYWSPAWIGGLVAAGLILAAVQALTRPIAPGATPPVQASRETNRSLALKVTPRLSNR